MPVQIDRDFPGGNIAVEAALGDDVKVHQELRDTAGPWFYWCFRARGAGGRTLRFEFTQSRAIGVHGPAVSLDDGMTWRWLGRDHVRGNGFVCAFPRDAGEVRLSFGMPYQEAHWRRFVASLAGNLCLSTHTLCTTPKRRDVEYALAGCLTREPLHRVVVTCRHHCCEMMASYALEGLIRWVVADDGPAARRMRETVQVLIVPFVDKDGVEDGDQGKNRRPRDHGRDYEGRSLYASTGALRDLLPRWSDGRLRLGLDLHCPGIAGAHNEAIYVVGSRDDRIAREQQAFSRILESVCRGPLPFRADDFLPFGQAWNTDKNCAEGKGFSRWLDEWPEPVPGIGFEIPYANAGGVEVNQESARQFGEDLGRAVAAELDRLETTRQAPADGR